MSVVRLTYPPCAESLWRVEDGRIVKGSAYRDWLTAAREAIRASAHPAVFGRYRLSITAHRPCEPSQAARDIDTVLGPLTAALAAAGLVGGDDSLAERIVIRWAGDTAPGGQLEVEAKAA